MTKEELKQEAEEYRLSKADCQYFSEPYKMKIERAYIAGAEPREKRIAELEEELQTVRHNKHTVAHLGDCIEKIQGEKIAELEKENAELKNRNQELLESCEGATMMYKDLQKAKKLLKQFLEAKNGEDTYKAEWEAEQFLKDSEGK